MAKRVLWGAAALAARGVKLAWALDEGMMVTDRVVRDVPAPIAPIGIGEKGYLSMELAVDTEGGHASMPPRETSLGLLASAITRVHSLPAHLDGAARLQMSSLAPYMPFGRRIALANLWLFSPLVVKMAEAVPAMNAGLRTTIAPTIFASGEKDNVLPTSARAVINSRILPGETVESVLAQVQEAVGDPRIQVKKIDRGAHDPPPLSPVDARGYQLVEATVARAFPTAVIVPALVLGATDGRHYRPLANGVYRFAPFTLRADDLPRVHGPNERVKISDLPIAVRAYMELMREGAKN